MANSVLCGVTLVWAPGVGPLRTAMRGTVNFDIVMWISKEYVCAFFGLVSWVGYF